MMLHWPKTFASQFGSLTTKILGIDCGYIIRKQQSEINLKINESDIESLAKENCDGNIYTFDELCRKVADFKEYLAEVNKRNKCLVDIKFKSTDNMEDISVESEINIKQI